MVSEWGTVRKPVGRGFPHTLVGCMRGFGSDDRQVSDLQCDALLAAGVDPRHLLRIGSPGAAVIVAARPRRWLSSNPAIAWSSGSCGWHRPASSAVLPTE
jgi:hypothetical protein